MAHKVKALQQWCKLRCDGYRDVAITNFTSSWKSGLAFCAIIHRYRPDLIDYDSLKKEDTYGNSKKAFDVALHELGIAALLDPEDMVAMTVPDKLCIVTYVAQYYNYFHNKEMLGGPGVKTAVKRSLRMTDVLPSPEPPKNLNEITNKPTVVVPAEKQVSPAAKRRTIEDRCCMCQGKVYLLERHYSGGKLYHRHCCREAERSSTLRLNKENCGPSGEKNDNSFGGRPPAADANKTPSMFGGNNSSAKPDYAAAPEVSKPASTGVMKSLFVPSKYPSSGVSSEASKVPADTSKTITTGSSGASAPLSPYAPKTASTSRIWGLTPTTTSASSPSNVGTSNYWNAASKSSTPAMTPATTSTVKSSYTPGINTTAKLSTPVATTVKSPTPERFTATTVIPYTPGTIAANTGKSPTPATATVNLYTPGAHTASTAKSPTPVTTTVNLYTPGALTAGAGKSSAPAVTITLKSPTPATTTVNSYTPGINTASTGKSLAPSATITSKSSTPEPNTNTFSKWFGGKNSAQPSKDTATAVTAKTTSTATTTPVSNYLISNPKSTISSGSKLSPGIASTAVTSSSGTSKYTSIFASRTTPTATPSVTPTTTVPSAGYISTVTKTVSGQVPSHQTGLKDVSFTFKVGNTNNTPTIVSPASEASNKPVTSVYPIAKSPTGLGPTGKGATEAAKCGKDTSAKPEWQLEAERRQKTRNGAYVDPEKYPQRNHGPGVTGSGPVENERNVGKKEIDSTKDTEKTNAKHNLVTILQKQLNTKGGPNRIPSPAIEVVPPQTSREDSYSPKFSPAVPPQTSREDSYSPRFSPAVPAPTNREESNSVKLSPVFPNDTWVIVEKPEYDDTRPGISRSPPFRVPGTEIISVEASPLSPPDAWKKVVIEGNIGFSNANNATELSRRQSIESSPRTISKQIHVVRNPSVPKRKVHAEQKVSVDQINKGLVSLDQKLRVVETKGRKLEDKIRGETDDAMDEDEEEVMIEWFALVKQKYELVRDESDLMYRKRQQELEELHEELEYQYRCLSSAKPDDEKTYNEREEEKQLIIEICEVVKLRDNIVNSIEIDRQRYLEEDEQIRSMMEASGISDTGKGKNKRKKNKKNKKFPEKGGVEKRKSFLGFRRSSSVKSNTAKDVE